MSRASFLGDLSNPEDTLLFYCLGRLQILLHKQFYFIKSAGKMGKLSGEFPSKWKRSPFAFFKNRGIFSVYFSLV